MLDPTGGGVRGIERELGQERRALHRVDVAHGLENAPETLARLFRGDNQGKQLLRIAD